MKMSRTAAGLAIAMLLATAGCSTRQVYNSAQSYERNQCERMLDQGARERCLAGASAGYDEYRRQADEAAKK